MSLNIKIDNKSLIEECRNGNKEALSLFYTRFAPKMSGVINRYVKDKKDAEDILHDGFIIAYTRLESLRDGNRVDYWLATIMKNLSLQFLQSQDVTGILEDLPEIEDAADIDDIIDMDVIDSLVSKLPTGYQTVFRLAVLENKSHKEIGKLLGIAPNSSSSQLFHAKLMMRRLISDYKKQAGLLSVLLLAISFGYLILSDSNRDMRSETPAKVLSSGIRRDNLITGGQANESVPATPPAPPASIARHKPSAKPCDKPAEPSADTTQENVTQPQVKTPAEYASVDTMTLTTTEEPVLYAYNSSSYDIKRHKGWSLGVGVNTGFTFNSQADGSIYDDDLSSSGPGDNETPEPKPETPEPATHKVKPRDTQNHYRDYRDVARHNDMPVTVQITAGKSLSGGISVETGLAYTYLKSSFESRISTSDCRCHYICIPIKLNVSMLSTGRMRMYGSLGARMDIPVYSSATVTTINGKADLRDGRFDSPVVWSLTASCGIAFKTSGRTEIFAEPTLEYHFKNNYTVPNLWTDRSTGISIPVGFRFKW